MRSKRQRPPVFFFFFGVSIPPMIYSWATRTRLGDGEIVFILAKEKKRDFACAGSGGVQARRPEMLRQQQKVERWELIDDMELKVNRRYVVRLQNKSTFRTGN